MLTFLRRGLGLGDRHRSGLADDWTRLRGLPALLRGEGLADDFLRAGLPELLRRRGLPALLRGEGLADDFLRAGLPESLRLRGERFLLRGRGLGDRLFFLAGGLLETERARGFFVGDGEDCLRLREGFASGDLQRDGNHDTSVTVA